MSLLRAPPNFFSKSLENEARFVYYIKRGVCNHDCPCMSHVFILNG